MNARAIEFHTGVLRRLLAMLLVYAGLTDENEEVRSYAEMRRCASEPFTLSRRIRDVALKLLVPVESATRRLIVVLASQLPVEERRAAAWVARPAAVAEPGHDSNPGPSPALTPLGAVSLLPSGVDLSGLPPPCGEGLGMGVGQIATPTEQSASVPPRLPLFALADTPKRYDWFFNPKPEGSAPWSGPGIERADPWERLDAQPLMRRVAALAIALDDLQAQAKRFIRWRAARLRARAAGRHIALSAMRVGFAPGSLPHRAPERLRLEEHHTLHELHMFALYAEKQFDSS